MLEKEFNFFKNNRKSLIKKYKNRYVVIVGENVVGDYSTEEEAYFDSVAKYELGTFLIQLCSEDDSSMIETFHSQVIYRNERRA